MDEPTRRLAILRSQFRVATKEKCEFVKYAIIDEAHPEVWHVLLHGFAGDKGEYVGGEYIVRVELPEKFPFEPPKFYFLTPNGLYEKETVVCIDIGEYHKENYRATLGVRGFVAQLMSGLIGWKTIGNGISLLKTKVGEKQRLATASSSYNYTHHEAIMTAINASYDAYSAKWPANSK